MPCEGPVTVSEMGGAVLATFTEAAVPLLAAAGAHAPDSLPDVVALHLTMLGVG